MYNKTKKRNNIAKFSYPISYFDLNMAFFWKNNGNGNGHALAHGKGHTHGKGHAHGKGHVHAHGNALGMVTGRSRYGHGTVTV
jgi:hypothetical protein